MRCDHEQPTGNTTRELQACPSKRITSSRPKRRQAVASPRKVTARSGFREEGEGEGDPLRCFDSSMASQPLVP